MQLSKILTSDVDVGFDERWIIPRQFKLPKVIWGKFFEYISVQDECHFRQSAHWTNYLLKNIGKYGQLSPQKTRSLFFFKNHHETKFINQKIEYRNTWYQRILHVSIEKLGEGILTKDVFNTFPNLISLQVPLHYGHSFFDKNSKIFSKKQENNVMEKNDDIVVDSRITLIFDKSLLYILAKQRIKFLFERFPNCINIQFIFLASTQNEKIALFKRWGLIPQKISAIFENVKFERKDKTIDQLKKQIENEKKKMRNIENDILKEQTFSNRYLFYYFHIDTGLKKGITSRGGEAMDESELKAIEEGNPVAMYDRFVRINKLPENLVALSEDERAGMDHRGLFYNQCMNKSTLLHYHLLEQAVMNKFPPAQYLFAKIEFVNPLELRNTSFQEKPMDFLKFSAEAGYIPAIQFVNGFNEMVSRKRKLESITNDTE